MKNQLLTNKKLIMVCGLIVVGFVIFLGFASSKEGVFSLSSVNPAKPINPDKLLEITYTFNKDLNTNVQYLPENVDVYPVAKFRFFVEKNSIRLLFIKPPKKDFTVTVAGIKSVDGDRISYVSKRFYVSTNNGQDGQVEDFNDKDLSKIYPIIKQLPIYGPDYIVEFVPPYSLDEDSLLEPLTLYVTIVGGSTVGPLDINDEYNAMVKQNFLKDLKDKGLKPDDYNILYKTTTPS